MAVELSKKEIVKVGDEFSIAYGAWGNKVTNENLFKRFPDDDQNLINFTRIVTRHQPEKPSPFLENRGKIGQEMVDAGLKIVRETLATNGWKKADHLVLASSTPPDKKGLWGSKIAEEIGAKDVKFSYLACDGAIAGLLDVLKTKSLADKRVVILAVEALGYLANPEKIADLTIFGNGGAAMAFRPRSIQLLNGKTVIIPDQKGVIRSPKTYTLPNKEDRIKIPDWYEIRENGEEVFAYSKKGAFLALPEPLGEEQSYMQMNGTDTAIYFKRLVPSIQVEVLKEYYSEFGRDNLINLSISHQPSGVIKKHTTKRLAALLEQEGLPPIEKSPWVMDEVGMGNVSSATTLIALAELIKMISKDEVFNITSYGIGSAITSINVRLKL